MTAWIAGPQVSLEVDQRAVLVEQHALEPARRHFDTRVNLTA